ncbi:succinate dehydrogenase, hydrophobic membrane anchor protein [Hyphomicrobiales bacterium]|jgi:succinate dehydrogenase / fumarate reductase membrane anchor subunit|nr:succinate dehydrogenase, hydrophobic membrane anchor protein [Alphaproteobacteria bacterium]MDC0474982.1 succinate dehydrogenase, hydrophobic membrane anchor protein [Hyphomicrobiales bacterium]MBT4909896.1 succinate dehydrogenase, hydrophobic membrane anchor protein [Alphaproteobacteria bacterium]MDG1153009.1 succinate dehydrogenase, hydrophobic membrane anchor protein [Hyphomicrobiales bacterium]MDG1523950.1 succinate dehydrogenase, hydrophobic membrane anchor protein [Hyphomicrobiales bac|tara:strand:- start:1297 stop:1641 length:345 start_codon:yes stop_codon:yes gene_type:complete
MNNKHSEGTHHFILQRITAVINLFLGVYVFNFFIKSIGKSYETVIDILGNNFMWLVITIFSLSMCYHMWIGFNHILDDYVDEVKARKVLGSLNSFVVVIVALATSFSMITIGFF